MHSTPFNTNNGVTVAVVTVVAVVVVAVVVVVVVEVMFGIVKWLEM